MAVKKDRGNKRKSSNNIEDGSQLDKKPVELGFAKPWVLALANCIDHTLLNPTATTQDIVKLCAEAAEYKMFAVCVNPFHVKRAVRELSSTQVVVATVVGFPLGVDLTDIKIAQAQRALFEGAEELDMVINIGALNELDTNYVLNEIQSIVRVAKDQPVKVIIECDLLSQGQKILATQICAKAGAAMVKTSTGFVKDGKGATVEDVILLKQTIDNLTLAGGKEIKIKASGGIKDYNQAMALIEAGATRLGTSSSVNILSQARYQGSKTKTMKYISSVSSLVS
jgi:deoxyribose-phosphate aldolase